ncbi:MAG: pilin [Candidatus Saccharibacteria bacterium]|nr:pilin [Candidatus Saccharibacteria bacterium]
MKRLLSAVVFGIIVGMLAPAGVMAWEDPACADMDAEERELAGCNASGPTEDTLMEKIGGVLNAVLPMAAVLAVVMIVVAGIMMSVSMGDPGKVKRAKNMIIYSLIGLIVALMAWGIVNAVLNYIE